MISGKPGRKPLKPMPYIEHQYGRTYYQRRGSARARGLPLVCLHGGPGGHSRFMTDLFDLADERQVYIYDQVGGGRSSQTDKRFWKVTTFVRELDYLVKSWGLEHFHLFGGSWGTTLALEYYLRHRRKVASLLFQSPMFSASDWQRDADRLVRNLPAGERKVIRYCHEIGATDAQVYKDAMALYYSRHVCRNRTRTKQAANIKNPHGNAVYEYMWGASEFNATGTLKNYDRTSELSSIRVPTLLVCGQHDEATPATGRRYAAKIDRASFVEIPRASHAILAEKPKRLVSILRRFLKTSDP